MNNLLKRIISYLLILITCLTFINLPGIKIDGRAAGTYHRGVNIAGPEQGNVVPGVMGTDYSFNDEATFAYFANKGFDIARIPVLWERLQHNLNDPLDTQYLNGLKSNIIWAKKYNMKVAIDIHNYGRYKRNVIGSSGAPVASYIDLWVKLSNEFKNESGIYGYDIMNEPFSMGTGAIDWKVISQQIVTAIRDNGDKQLIIVEGTSYANAAGWESKNKSATSWITDPANNFIYSAHCYFDSDQSGTYLKTVNNVKYPTTYDDELTKNSKLATVGTIRVMDFISWCLKNNVRGLIGEFGEPGDDIRWNAVLDDFMKTVDYYGFDTTYWAAGIRWGDYRLSVQPDNNYTTDKPQMSVLSKYMPHFEPIYTQPTLIKGINFNGPALTLNGQNWIAQSDALNDGLTISACTLSTKTTTFNPPVSADIKTMFTTSIYNNGDMTIGQNVDNGNYQIYLWVTEAYSSNSMKFNVSLENNQVASEIGCMPRFGWARYGPYNANVSDRNLTILLSKVQGNVLLNGIEIYQVGAAVVNKIATTATDFTANITKQDTSNAVLVMTASKDSKLVGMKIFNINSLTGTANYKYIVGKDFDSAKAFIWNGTTNFQPISLPISVANSN